MSQELLSAQEASDWQPFELTLFSFTIKALCVLKLFEKHRILSPSQRFRSGRYVLPNFGPQFLTYLTKIHHCIETSSWNAKPYTRCHDGRRTKQRKTINMILRENSSTITYRLQNGTDWLIHHCRFMRGSFPCLWPLAHSCLPIATASNDHSKYIETQSIQRSRAIFCASRLPSSRRYSQPDNLRSHRSSGTITQLKSFPQYALHRIIHKAFTWSSSVSEQYQVNVNGLDIVKMNRQPLPRSL